MSVKYFSIHRPIGPGTYPKIEKVLEIVNFDKMVYCNEVGRTAWGYIVFENKIDERSARMYELMEEGKIFYKLMCMQREDKVKFSMPLADYTPGRNAIKPKDEVIDHGKDKIVIKWFESLEDARDYVNSHKTDI